jgi:selenocysteine lyase/cysteine desulfurase
MADLVRDAFELEPGVCYLNAASIAPIPRLVAEAGTRGVHSKAQPWLRSRAAAAQVAEDVRRMAGVVVGAAARNMAIVNAVSYGIATACKSHTPPAGSRILLLAAEHTSLALSLAHHAARHGCHFDVVEPAPGQGWTEAVLEAIARPDAPPVSLAGLTPVHWTDGALVDLDRIAPALRAQGAALLVDATQAAGVLPLDVAALDPDWLIFPTYKWLLGSYSLAFLYVADRHLENVPLEQHIGSRTGADPALVQDPWDLPQSMQASRFDVGERDNFTAIPMAAAALRFLADWPAARVHARLKTLTDQLADGLSHQPVQLVAAPERAPHILGIRRPASFDENAVHRLTEQQIFVSVRRGVMRVSPHIYNDAQDIQRFCDALRSS